MECDDCGSSRWKLHRHHIIPKSLGGSDEPPNVVSVCANCHEDRHGGSRTDSLPWQLAHTPEAKAKRSATMIKLWLDPDYRAKQMTDRASRVGVPRSRETRDRLSLALKGKPFTPEHRAALSASHKAARAPLSPETREKISLAKRGRAFTDEHRAKLSAARAGKPSPRKGMSIQPEIRVCLQCGKNFEVGGRGRPKKSAIYCSNLCSRHARLATITTTAITYNGETTRGQ